MACYWVPCPVVVAWTTLSPCSLSRRRRHHHPVGFWDSGFALATWRRSLPNTLFEPRLTFMICTSPCSFRVLQICFVMFIISI
ncbi:hypothetical protein B0T24DRAFT_605056 [Lasiosphaeria ovina]|uniref:Uncharacterized protein n=1 Tax=Lasiosphaeria ovina TaxID=92902 RepID=A0AAE0NL41_9PEZI|nr:hypothetical protein B0T24DRAFT_605056 [Lasiosphaeria ovina]